MYINIDASHAYIHISIANMYIVYITIHTLVTITLATYTYTLVTTPLATYTLT